MAMGETLKEFFGYFFGHEVLRRILGTFGSAAGEKVAEKATETIQSRVGGLGVNDEVLFWDACDLAMTDFGVSKGDILRIANVLKELKPRQRNEVINIIGRDEQDFKAETRGRDKWGKPTSTATTEKKNRRGARFIALLAKMEDDEIKTFLSASGATETTVDDIEAVLEELEATLGKRWKALKKLYVNFSKVVAENKKAVKKFDRKIVGKIPIVEDPGFFRGVFGFSPSVFSGVLRNLSDGTRNLLGRIGGRTR